MPHHKERRAATSENATTTTEFKTVLRIRPLLKKERDDVIALEKLSRSTGVLHPLVLPFADGNSNSASADDVVQTGQDTEFRFDRVLSASDMQDKLYQVVGQPMALASMESLKQSQHGPITAPTRATKTHLVITTGLQKSGKTFASIGPHVSKRKNDTDGLVPRIVDSLFAQSKHNFNASSSQMKKMGFAVEISVLQVNQCKSNPNDCEMYDLLQPVPKLPHKRTVANNNHHNSSTETPSLGSAVGSLASTLRNFSGASHSFSTTSSSATPKSSSNYAALEEGVQIQQDPTTSECFLVNATERQLESAEEARETLQKVLDNSRNLQHKKYQSHLFIKLRPLLVSSRSGRTLQTGEVVAVLDLAVKPDGKHKSQRAAHHHLRTALPKTGEDAYTSTMLCLKTMQQNMEILQARTRKRQQNNSGQDCQDELRKVPFLQHKLTMLMQPLFSINNTDKTTVTLLVTASPSGCDHVEKEVLLNEIVALYRPPPKTAVSTGLLELTTKKSQHKPHTPLIQKKVKEMNSTDKDELCSDAREQHRVHSNVSKRDHANQVPLITALQRKPSMTYSDTTDEDVESLPPAVAPGYKETTVAGPIISKLWSPEASAPCSVDAHSPVAVQRALVPPPVLTVDFPGVPVPLASTRSALTDLSSRETPKDENRKQPLPNAPIEVIAEEIPMTVDSHQGTNHSTSGNKFSYMKTINKVVHASKKKGRRVMEQMTFTSFTGDPTELQNRVLELEEANATLQQEKAVLREKNKILQQKLHKKMDHQLSSSEPTAHTKVVWKGDYSRPSSSPLRSKTENVSVSQSAYTNDENDEEDDDDDISSCDSLSSYQAGTPPQLSSKCNKSNKVATADAMNFADVDSPSVASPKYDNALLEHMANMDNPRRWNHAYTTGTKHSAASATRSPNISSCTKAEDENTFSQNAPSSSCNMFDDPLFQHMAMMNNYG